MKSAFTSLCLFTLIVFSSGIAKAAIIKGKVTDTKGVVLPYASVFIEGTTIGASANANGNYELTVQPGKYKVVCQYIGFTQSVFTVEMKTDEVIVHNFVMKDETLKMKEVVVHASEDPAYTIIRKTIERRSFHLGQVRSFQTGIYLKGVARTRVAPDKVFGKKVDKGEMGLDTTGKGVIYLCEEDADYYSTEPNKTRTIIHSVKESGNPNGMGFSRLPSVTTFYENNIAIFNPRGYVSPISDNALHYYKYKYQGEFKENGYVIDKIEVKPRRPYEPLFTGTIYIAEEDWAIHSLSMTLTGKANLDFLDTVRIEQLFLPLRKDTWVAKEQVFYFTMGIFGFGITGNFVTVYSRQKVNEPIPDSIFHTKFVSEYDNTANKKDSSYWTASRPIPLEADEKKDYRLKDSIRMREEDPNYIDSLRRVDNKLKVSNIFLWGVTEKTKQNRDIIQTNSLLLGAVNYNTVEGLNIAPKVNWSHRLDSSNFLLSRVAIRYGFSNTHFNAIARLVYLHNSRSWQSKWWQLGAEGGKYVFQYNSQNPVPELYNTFTTLEYNQNYMKIYERCTATAFFKQSLGNGFDWNINVSYQQRLPLQNTVYYTFMGGGETNLTSNLPKELNGIEWMQHDAVIASVALNYQPGFTYTKYPDHITPHSSDWPIFSLNYQKGIPDVLNSKTDFDKWRFGISQAISLRLFGALSYNIATGGFLNANYVSLPDLMHINGNQLGLLEPGFYMHGFELAPYYRYSNTANLYGEAHVEYNLLGLLTNKIPLLRQARWYAIIGNNTLYISGNNYYTEAFIGIDNIGFKILRGIRVDFVRSWDNFNNISTGIRVGFKFANAVSVSRTNSIDRGEEW